MKKHGILNQALSNCIAGLGHMDEIVIGDAGLPAPPQVPRIDLALTAGIPSFLDALDTVLGEMQVEGAVIAQELADGNEALLAAIRQRLGGVPLHTVAHERFKERTRTSRTVIRTGEFTPYANIILISGVVF